jgi:N-acetyl-gamma-glutamyl-phosphate reductase
MITAHIVGASGYAAAELIRLLDGHPDVAIGALESESGEGLRVCDVFPMLATNRTVLQGSGAVANAARAGDVVFLAGSHELAHARATTLLERGVRVIDLSDAFRLSDRANGAVYGWPERYRAALAGATFVANPGCYVTASLLALLPLEAYAAEIAQIVIDAKSGITGSGRKPALGSLFAEVDGDVRAYGLGGHRHHPEIVQELRALGIDVPVIFSPHVVPLKRGILADVYVTFRNGFDLGAIRAAYERTYAASPFVQVLDGVRVPYLPSLDGTNDAQIALAARDGILHVMSGIDNLGKGAAGQAVQNLNCMLGFPEERALGFDRTARLS